MIKKSLLFLLFLCYALFAYSEGKLPCIIYLKGTCCAGKSTLIKSISGKWENLEIVDEDAMVYPTFPREVGLRFPLEFKAISKAIADENLYHALRIKDVLFKKTATQEECTHAQKLLHEIQEELNLQHNLTWKKEINEGIRKRVIDTIQSALKQNKHVLLDSWYFTARQIQAIFPETAVIRLMLYCPFPVAYERLLKRNKEALALENLDQKRYVLNLMESFCSLYQLSANPSQPVQIINRGELETIFNQIALGLNEENRNDQIFTFGELSRSEFQELQAEFMQPFIESNSVNLYLSPKEKQDIIVDSTIGDLQQALDFLEKIMF